MDKKLEKLFDYQKFSGNKRIEKMAMEADDRYKSRSAKELDDSDLSQVNAAGTAEIKIKPKKKGINQ